ncbi:MAG TPA: CDP-diacylglycerol--serine O-phosphatidyltransferase [Armatimonadota bacterium]|jgi:CDP-diacylglycerol--serine O-phosphatidyltransferase
MKKSRLCWLPNLLTMGNLFCGVLAIIFAIRGEDFYSRAMIVILIGGLFDFFDGFAARKLHVSSDIGRELDSLADVISFGVAPAILLYERALAHAHLPGAVSWLGIAAISFYVCCGAWRLARHNVLTYTGRKPYFTGMPIEGGTALLLAFVLSSAKHIESNVMVIMALISVVVAGFLMISTLRFTANVPWPVRLGALAMMVIAFKYPGPWTILLPLSYIAYGIACNLLAAKNGDEALNAAMMATTPTEEQVPVFD